ncbi:MAG: hypothetical protein COU27_03145 [Candidatus Levybacteria bacterium CG10_big_fil_rev_8_21_14_0_10_36_7]|nr:MAG: hypothetical protein COU27_03145 [Candidatus Levybacteria bacterium CG10_big_fil_rev_8_21_14_0_10_36_7]
MPKLEGEPTPNLFAEEDKKPLDEGKSFKNLRRFMGEVSAPIRIYPQSEKPDYLDKGIYFPPLSKGQTIEDYNEGFEIMGEYLGLDLTLEEVGKSSKRSKKTTYENIRVKIKRRVEQAHRNVSEDVRERFPFESFDFRRPWSLASRQKKSIAMGGKNVEIARRIAKGESFDDIRNDFSSTDAYSARKIMERWGITLGREDKIVPSFEGLRDSKKTKEEIQELLDQITNPSQVNVLKKAGLIVAVMNIAGEAGLYLRGKDAQRIRDIFRRNRLPLAKVALERKGKVLGYYSVVATINKEEAVGVLGDDKGLDDLRTNPVILLAGPEGKSLPNTTELVHSGEYVALGNLIGEIRRMRWSGRARGGIKTGDIIKDSPATIYFAGTTNYYKKSEEDMLRVHLESRMKELGII